MEWVFQCPMLLVCSRDIIMTLIAGNVEKSLLPAKPYASVRVEIVVFHVTDRFLDL